MSHIVTGDRVTHRNASLSYGDGVVVEVITSGLVSLRPHRARVQFDADRSARTVYIGDLTRSVTPAPMPGSVGVARFCWPPERAGEPVAPSAA